jgi:hypothetical protein
MNNFVNINKMAGAASQLSKNSNANSLVENLIPNEIHNVLHQLRIYLFNYFHIIHFKNLVK